ncbi:MAG: heavy metal-associated domain-containing protein [Bacteroidota bacterium]|nr:heavy-metal-associated domain-containing protein [Candidatus Kapabacteria bacterium]MDW8075689.1 heavy metal-associated domain-containing protein [Bacteroidota bacterium]MDW8272254.1 heavy metal-associated domain-containing protein [Bacteroidota bacterium]
MAKVVEQTFPVRGAHCSNCLRTIERALAMVEGVRRVSATLDDGGRVTVEYDAEVVTPQGLRAALERVGYELVIQ